MKNLKALIPVWLLTICTLFTLSGCNEEWWIGNDGIEGTWIIDQIDINDDYRAGDAWTFDYSGRFYADGDGGFYQNGYWSQDGRYIYIRFDDTWGNNPELSCRIRQYDGESMELYVTDYGYGTTYRVILVRSYYGAEKK